MKKIFVNGSFDLIHTGHLDMLNYAKSLGDYLLVGIDTDQRISDHKGLDRPVNPLHIRKAVMENFKAVDRVAVFGSDQQLIDIIRDYQPDVMVKGSDWKDGVVIGAEYCKHVDFFDRVNDESSTKTIEDFINRRQLL